MHAAISKSVILFLVLVLFTDTYTHVPEIESEKVGRWKTFLWLYKSGQARRRPRKGSKK